MGAYTVAELLEEGEGFDAGDQTEESLILTVDFVEVKGKVVRI
ncbi:hypothetical protein ABZ490_14350 [Streptomyces sp. NPDC005811]